MRTDELIAVLAKAPRPKPPLRWAPALAALVAVITAVNVAVLGLRPDIGTLPVSMAHKSVLLLALLAVAGLMLARASRPVEMTRLRWLPGLVPATMFGASLVWEWSRVPPAAILHSFGLPNFPFCLGAVSIYGTAAAAALTWLMRYYAPADESRAATAVGFAAAAAGAVGYSVHCPVDSPTFVLVAYGLPISWVTLAARAVIARRIRW
jgi:hypothetical protein